MMPVADRVRSFLLVAVQFLCLILLLATGPVLPRHPLSIALLLAGLALGIWAFASMPSQSLHVLPDVRPGAALATSGPYGFIRHPMYAALLLLTLGLVVERPDLLRWGLWLALFLDLAAKLHYEEALLLGRFPDYAAYQARTHRLLPYVW